MTRQQRQIVHEITVLANPWTWGCLAMATSIWAPGAAVRAWKRALS